MGITVPISWPLPHSLGETKRPVWRGLCQAQGQSPGQVGPLGSLLDSPPVTSRPLFRGRTIEKCHCESHPWGQSQRLPALREPPPATRSYGEGRHGTGSKSFSLSTPLQTMGKEDSSEVARGRQTQAPGTKGGLGFELIGRYLINVG